MALAERWAARVARVDCCITTMGRTDALSNSATPHATRRGGRQCGLGEDRARLTSAPLEARSSRAHTPACLSARRRPV
eukprot:7031437-Prymnesium_polylepis.1